MALSQRRERLVRRLHRRKSRVREGAVLVEGVRAVSEALDGGANALFALLTPELDRTAEGAALRSRLAATTECEAVADAELATLAATERPQGVLLVAREPDIDIGAAISGDVLVLDAVQDPGNVGTLIRSAAAFGFSGVVCLDGTADPWGPKAVRSSAGTAFRIPVWRCELSEALARLEEAGCSLVVGAADGRPLAGLVESGRQDAATRFGVVVGNEGAGVRDGLRDAAYATVAIEMKGPVESLNAGIAGSILMYRISEVRA